MTLDKLTMEQLHGSQLEIAEVIGIEAYRKLVASYGGFCDEWSERCGDLPPV